MTRQVLSNLLLEEYEHPSDRKALDSLEKMPGISALFKKVNEYGIDKILRLQCVASDIRVTPNNFPELYAAFVETCNILEVEQPEFYLIRGNGHIQTFTYGVENSIVMINLEGLEELTSEEWVFLLGHEIAHIKSQHMLYYQSAIVLPTLKHILSTTTLGLGGLATSGVELALFNWLMMAKFTADRAGLLACQNLDVAISCLIKLAGLPSKYVNNAIIQDFKQQAEEFETNSENKLDQVAKTLSFMEHTYPWSVIRASELLKWAESGAYEQILNKPKASLLTEEKETEEGPPHNNDDGPGDPPHWNFINSW